jgi:hypothetical protein
VVRLRFFVSLGLGLLAIPVSAHAEPTSWVAVGGGYALERQRVVGENDTSFALDAAVGVGTPPTGPLVVGGVFRAVGYVGGLFGVDMSVAARVATRGYCVGDWGLALDLGPGVRLLGGGQYGSYPLQGTLTLGAPFGLQLAAGVSWFDVALQKPSAEGGFVALELDFLRLTSMRTGETTKVWSNPAPANAPPAPDPVTP